MSEEAVSSFWSPPSATTSNSKQRLEGRPTYLHKSSKCVAIVAAVQTKGNICTAHHHMKSPEGMHTPCMRPPSHKLTRGMTGTPCMCPHHPNSPEVCPHRYTMHVSTSHKLTRGMPPQVHHACVHITQTHQRYAPTGTPCMCPHHTNSPEACPHRYTMHVSTSPEVCPHRYTMHSEVCPHRYTIHVSTSHLCPHRYTCPPSHKLTRGVYEVDTSEAVQEESSALQEWVHTLLQTDTKVIRIGKNIMRQAETEST